MASHAADAYARVTGKASVVLSHLSPGLTNAATGVANAALDCIPMVVISGDVPSFYFGKHPHQEVNLHSDGAQYEIYRPFVKRAWRVETPALFPETIEKAFALAESGQQGPVLVDVPMNIFSERIDSGLFERLKGNDRNVRPPSLDRDTAVADRPGCCRGRTAGAVCWWRRPLGPGELPSCRRSSITWGYRLPIASWAKGRLSDDHPLVLGMTGFWGTSLVNQKTLGADVILGDRNTVQGSRQQLVVSALHLRHTADAAPTHRYRSGEIGRNFPTEIGAVADAKAALRILVDVARELYPDGFGSSKLTDEIAEFRTAFVESNKPMATSDAWPMMPERILADCRTALPDDAYIVTDVGWNKNGVGQQFPDSRARHVPDAWRVRHHGIRPSGSHRRQACRSGSDRGLPGWRRRVRAEPGDAFDGRRAKLDIVWVVMNNNAYGTIAGLEKAHFDTVYGTTFPGKPGESLPDYSAIAKAYGADGFQSRRPISSSRSSRRPWKSWARSWSTSR